MTISRIRQPPSVSEHRPHSAISVCKKGQQRCLSRPRSSFSARASRGLAPRAGDGASVEPHSGQPQTYFIIRFIWRPQKERPMSTTTAAPAGPDDSFVGTDVYTLQTFQPGSAGIVFEAVAKFDQTEGGMVGGIFPYMF